MICTFRLRKIRKMALRRPCKPEPVSRTASDHPKAALGGELRQTGQLPIQVRFLLPGGNPRVQGHTGWLVRWRGVENYRARGQLLGRHRQLASLPQAPRRLVGKSLLPGPGAQFHASIPSYTGIYDHIYQPRKMKDKWFIYGLLRSARQRPSRATFGRGALRCACLPRGE
jgi:hypothetical protein